MLSIARQKSWRILGFSSSRMLKLLKRLSRLAKSSLRSGGFLVIRFQIAWKILLIRILVLILFNVIHVFQQHERHAFEAGVHTPNFLLGWFPAKDIGKSISGKLNKSFLVLSWFRHVVL